MSIKNNSSYKKFGAAAFGLLVLFAVLSAVFPAIHPMDGLDSVNRADVVWMLTSSALVLLMTPGLSFFYGGMVGARNIISTMLQSFVALGLISLVWYAFGFSLVFGESINGLIGNPFTFAFFNGVGMSPHPSIGSSIPFMLFAIFQMKFAIITPALITGSFAERIRFGSYIIFMVLFSVLIYCPVAHWIWHPEGWLFQMGALDFAGGAVIHLSAGVAALAGAFVLGRRSSHLNNEIQTPSNIPYIMLGTGLLWFGWFGFNAGSSLAANEVAISAFLSTHMASAAAMGTWLLLDIISKRKPNAVGACIGAVVGLATVTPAAGYINPSYSILIGVLASVCSFYAVHWKTNAEIDDTLDVFPCHGIGGVVGMLVTGIFATSGGLITGSATLFGVQALTVLVVSAFSFGGCWAIMILINKISPLRVSAKHEAAGLDWSQHNEIAPEARVERLAGV
jgi:Amt family ammonium transporter